MIDLPEWKCHDLHQNHHVFYWISPRWATMFTPDYFDMLFNPDLSQSCWDRIHRKQGRLTARVQLELTRGATSLVCYLKHHDRERVPRNSPLESKVFRSAAATEWRHLESARQLGLTVPESVAAAVRVKADGGVQSLLLIREIDEALAVHEAIPRAFELLDYASFLVWKQNVVRRMAEMTALLHRAGWFHQDLYLCHFFVSHSLDSPVGHLTLIDFQRMIQPSSITRWRYRIKDLAQWRFSTQGVVGVEERDRWLFWRVYRECCQPPAASLTATLVSVKTHRYLRHHRKHQTTSPS